MPTATAHQPQPNTSSAVECRACSSRRIRMNQTVRGVSHLYVCRACGAVFGSCYLGDSYAVAKPCLVKGDVPPEQTCYFDLDCLGSEGITRRHGWIERTTGRLVQIG